MIDFGRPGIALFSEEAGPALSYAELGSWVGENRELLRRVRRPALAFLFSPNSATMVAAYLACLAEGVPLGLGEPTAEARARIVARSGRCRRGRTRRPKATFSAAVMCRNRA